MKKYIIPFVSFFKFVFSIIFFSLSVLDIIIWETLFVSIIMFILAIFFVLFGIKVIILSDNNIYVSPDLLIGWFKVQYKENIQLKNLDFIIIKQREYTYSSKGKEKTGRGIDSRISGHKFIEFNYLDETIKRIHCNDFSNSQINKIVYYCKTKNIKIKEENTLWKKIFLMEI